MVLDVGYARLSILLHLDSNQLKIFIVIRYDPLRMEFYLSLGNSISIPHATNAIRFI